MSDEVTTETEAPETDTPAESAAPFSEGDEAPDSVFAIKGKEFDILDALPLTMAHKIALKKRGVVLDPEDPRFNLKEPEAMLEFALLFAHEANSDIKKADVLAERPIVIDQVCCAIALCIAWSEAQEDGKRAIPLAGSPSSTKSHASMAGRGKKSRGSRKRT